MTLRLKLLTKNNFMEGLKNEAFDKLYQELGKKAVFEKYHAIIRQRSRINYKKQLEVIAIENGVDIKELYKQKTEQSIEELLNEGLLKF